MPHSTMHLWFAKKVAENSKFEPGARYYLGSIAPDAVTIRKNAGKQEKEISHLRQPEFSNGYKNAKKIFQDFKDDEFLKGCAIHIMFDEIWLKGPYLSILKKYKDKIKQKEINLQYNKDCKYLELWLFRQNTSRELWSALMSAPPERFFDILTPGEIDNWRKNCHMRLNKMKITTLPKYITLDVMRSFMEKSAEKLADEIRQIK